MPLCLGVFPLYAVSVAGRIVSLELLETQLRCHSFKIIQRLFFNVNLKEPVT